MSVASSGSPASDRSPERDDRHLMTPSPPDSLSHEYTLTRQSGTIWITPPHCSSTTSIATNLRTALEGLYNRIYGQDSVRCLLTLGEGGLNVAHTVQRASKSPELTLYEYCLGFDLGTFHVDSRQNLFYLASNWHQQFDANRWILLPSTAVLEDVRDFIHSVVSARKEPAQAAVPTFHSKWHLESKTKYTFIPLPSIKRDPLMHPKLVLSPETGQPGQQWDLHYYPYQTLPDLECHIAPPFAAINGGPKCLDTDLDALTLNYCQSSDSRPALKRRLELLREIWQIFQNAKEEASNWEQGKRGKRKREQEDEDIERLTQSTRRTTRSQSRISQGPTGNNVKQHMHTSGSHKRKAVPSLSGRTLTERAVFHLSKRQKTSDFHTTIKRWAKSIHG